MTRPLMRATVAGKKPGWTDAEMLAALEMRARGATRAKIGQALGRSRNACAEMLLRIDRETGPADRHDGTMPNCWWKAGLKEREPVA